MKIFLKSLPWALLGVFLTELVVVLQPKQDPPGQVQVHEFGRLPVLLNGRVQPMDSVGRNALLQIRGTGDVPLEEVPSWKFWKHPPKLRSTAWLMEVMLKPEVADTRPIFLIHHPELLSTLNLQDQGVEKSGLRFYTFDQIRPMLTEIGKQGSMANEVESQSRTAFQKQAAKLQNAVILYQRLKNSLRPEGAKDFARELADYEQALAPGLEAFRAREAGKTFDQAAFDRLIAPMSRFKKMADMAYPLLVPPLEPDAKRDNWASVGASLMEVAHSEKVHPAVKGYASMATAYGQDRPQLFNQAVAEYKDWLAGKFDAELQKGRAEYYFNQAKAFLHAMIIYLCAFVLAAGALLTLALAPNLSESLRRSAFYLVLLAGVVHTAAIIFRMVLEGRPPVTNLYSSAIFIGWGIMVFGVILEKMFKLGLGSAASAISGFLTLLIAHNLALGGDTMEMLRAVLDTNFWLATHVVVITLGYSAAFMAGFLAIAYVLLGLLSPLLSYRVGRNGMIAPAAQGAGDPGNLGTAGGTPGKNTAMTIGKILSSMVYAILCFATLFSFTGTVLGGIWADQSWGRFWGWDPKENGALIIVLWNAAVLHARWGGLIKERGLMGMAIFGNIVTSFSWFGVNMLGIGLHSYGFMDEAFYYLMLFMCSQAVLILVSLIPLRFWRSFRGQDASPPSQPSGAAPKTAQAAG